MLNFFGAGFDIASIKTVGAGAVNNAVPGPCEAMDGRARAHMDVLVACPGTALFTVPAGCT